MAKATSRLTLPKGMLSFTFLFLISASLSFQSCTPKMAFFNAESLAQTIAIKDQVIAVMKKGGKSFSSQETNVNALKTSINDQIDLEKARGDNNMKTVQMWETMMDPEEALLGGYLSRWEEEGTLNAPFMKEALKVVSDNFDKIISLEKKKRKPRN